MPGLLKPLLALLVVLAAATGIAAENPKPTVPAGEEHVGSLVSAGDPILVEGALRGDVSALGADVTIRGAVSGDVVLWGGRLELGPGGEVSGSVLLVGSKLEERGGRVLGKTLVWSDLGSMAEEAFLSKDGVPVAVLQRWAWGLRFSSLLAWLLVALALLVLGRGRLEAAATLASTRLAAAFVAGIVVFAALFFLSWGALALPWLPLRIALGAALVATGLFAKAWGLSSLLLAAGRFVGGKLRGNPPPPPVAITLGLALLGGLRLIPVVGDPAWVAVSIVGLGVAALSAMAKRDAAA